MEFSEYPVDKFGIGPAETRSPAVAPLNHRHVIGLDLLRLLAASLVVVYHFAFWNWTAGQPLALALPGQRPAWGIDLHFGWVGVEIFFIISGFVIAYTASDAAPASFLRSRFLRLAPANWIAATGVMLILLALGEPSAGQVLLRYAQTLEFWPLNAIDGVWWTLGIEIDFYLLTYLLIRRGHADRLEAVMIPIGLASGLFWAAALALQVGLDGQGGMLGTLHGLVLHAEGNRELQLLLIPHGCLFALGVVLWKASVFGMPTWRAAAAAALTAACVLEIVGQNGIINRGSHTDLSALPAVAAWAGAIGLLALSVVFNDALVRRIGRGAAAVRFAGLLTYPLYLLHNMVAIGTTWLLAPAIGVAAVIVGVVVAFLVAALVAGRLEPWLRRVIGRHVGGAARRQPAPT